MTDRTALARRALRGALETRRMAREAKMDPVCVYDVAERLGVEVKFCRAPSLGGGYSKSSGAVIVPSLRPSGRQVFTCAHELGHWFFGHGSRLDELYELHQAPYTDPDEELVDLYAAYLLMPPWAVEEALAARKWDVADMTPVRAYALASQLGVGYETIIQHLRFSLRCVSASHATTLLKTTPKQLRREILGDDRLRHLVLVDRTWRKIAVDLQVGDVAAIERDVEIQGTNATVSGTCGFGVIVEGVKPGIGLVQGVDSNWAVSVRVRRKDFEGRSIYRHMEDPDVDEGT